MQNASPSGCCVLFIDNPPDGFSNNNIALQSVKQHNVFEQLSLIKKTNSNNRKIGIHADKDWLSSRSKGNFFVLPSNGPRVPVDRGRVKSGVVECWTNGGRRVSERTGGGTESCSYQQHWSLIFRGPLGSCLYSHWPL